MQANLGSAICIPHRVCELRRSPPLVSARDTTTLPARIGPKCSGTPCECQGLHCPLGSARNVVALLASARGGANRAFWGKSQTLSLKFHFMVGFPPLTQPPK